MYHLCIRPTSCTGSCQFLLGNLVELILYETHLLRMSRGIPDPNRSKGDSQENQGASRNAWKHALCQAGTSMHPDCITDNTRF